MDYWDWRNREEAKALKRGVKRCRKCGDLNCFLSHAEPEPLTQGEWELD
jgi:hypothetical protein